MSANSVVVITGVGGMGAAVARRVGTGSTLVLADFDESIASRVATELRENGYDALSTHVDVGDPASVAALVALASSKGEVRKLVHTAGLSPVQASAEAILRVDLLGTVLVIEQFAEVMAEGGAGVFIASMAGSMAALDPTLEATLASTPSSELLELPALSAISDPNEAYGLAKRANQVRMWSASQLWGARGARINSISPGIIATPMGNAELEGPSGEMMRAMISSSARKRLGTPEDIAVAAEFLLSDEASFITGTDLLTDGGVVASLRMMLAPGASPTEITEA